MAAGVELGTGEERVDQGQSNVIKVLSIDGGGIRGVIPGRFLVELERITGKRVAELFDVIAGTSTGGIMALALARPGPDGRPAMAADEVIRIYSERGPKIFPKINRESLRPGHRGEAAKSIVQLAGAVLYPRHYGNARYVATGIESLLEEFLGDAKISQSCTDVVVTSYDWKAGRPIVFRSREARDGEGPDPLMREVARATSAAPTYFPPARLLLDDGTELVCIDGGVAANNPVSIGYYEFLRREEGAGRDLDVVVMSLGTGVPPDEIPTYEELWSRGWLSLGMGMLNVVFDGTSELQDEVVRKVVVKKEPKSRYFRFQPALRGCSLDLDDARPENVQALIDIADRRIEEQRGELEELAHLLLTTTGPGDVAPSPDVAESTP